MTLVERLRDAHENAPQRFVGSTIFVDAADEITRLTAENERLREVLLAVVSADDYRKCTGYSGPMFTALDLARAALEQP